MDQRMEPNVSIEVAVGSRASIVCARPFGALTCRTIPATISDSGSYANASKTSASFQRGSLSRHARSSPYSYEGLKRNFVRPRFAFALAFRRLFWFGVSKARSRRTSSRIPSASSLFFSRFNARSTGSPLRTITSGMVFSSIQKCSRLAR